MNHDDDQPDQNLRDGLGCVTPVCLVILAFCLLGLFLVLSSCAAPPKPTFESTVTNAAGKVVYNVKGSVDVPQDKLQAWFGPLGIVMGAAVATFQLLLPVPIVP